MSELEFISKVIEHLAWPLAIVLVVIALRKSVGRLLASLTRVKFRDWEMEFRRVEESASKIAPGRRERKPHGMSPEQRTIYATLDDQVLEVADRVPSAAIIVAWAAVETAMASAVARLAISPDPPSERSDRHNLVQLHRHGGLSDEMANLIGDLLHLRNQVTHDDLHRMSISPKHAKSYARSADIAIDCLNGLHR